jgi:hypothetical protein
MNLRFALKEIKNLIVCRLKQVGELWHAWNPQPTWREVLRLTIYETIAVIVLIVLIEVVTELIA